MLWSQLLCNWQTRLNLALLQDEPDRDNRHLPINKLTRSVFNLLRLMGEQHMFKLDLVLINTIIWNTQLASIFGLLMTAHDSHLEDHWFETLLVLDDNGVQATLGWLPAPGSLHRSFKLFNYELESVKI